MPNIADPSEPPDPDGLYRLEGAAVVFLAKVVNFFVKSTVRVVPGADCLAGTPLPVDGLALAGREPNKSIPGRNKRLRVFTRYLLHGI